MPDGDDDDDVDAEVVRKRVVIDCVLEIMLYVVTGSRRTSWVERRGVSLTCFESLFPAVEVHGCEFVVVGVGHERVEGLRLVDERSSVRR